MKILLGFLLLFATACGPKVSISPTAQNQPLSVLAVLPVQVDSDLAEERLRYLSSVLHSALAERHYQVLVPEAVQVLCQTSSCDEKAGIERLLGADASILFRIGSFSESNFIGGYFTRLSGALSVQREGTSLVQVDHSVSERGGIIFNPGQVLKGIVSQIDRFEDSGFTRIAQQLVYEMVKQLPLPKGDTIAEPVSQPSDVLVSDATATPLQKSGIKVCARGTPKAFATLFINSTRTPLREVSAGHYCTTFRNDAEPGEAFVEIKNVYGLSARRPLALNLAESCNIEGKVLLHILPGGERQLKISDVPAECMGSHYVVFRSEDATARPQRVGEFSGESWVEPRNPSLDETKSLYFLAIRTKGGKVVDVVEAKTVQTEDLPSMSAT